MWQAFASPACTCVTTAMDLDLPRSPREVGFALDSCLDAEVAGTAELLRYIPRYSLRAVRKHPMLVAPDLIEKLIYSMRLAGLPE